MNYYTKPKFTNVGPKILVALIKHFKLNINPDFNFTMYTDIANALVAKGIKRNKELSDEQFCKIIFEKTNLVIEKQEVKLSKSRLKKQKKSAAAEIKNKKISAKSAVNPNSNKFLSSFEWKRVRFLALNLYGRRCQCCGSIPDKNNNVVLNVDHIKPRKTNPELALDVNNLQILCGDCNHGKGNILGFDYRS